jgi:hypothetical protein
MVFYYCRIRYVPARFLRFSDRFLRFPYIFLLDPLEFRFGYDIRNRREKHVSGYGDFPVRNTASEFLCFSGRFLQEYVRILQERRRKGTVSCGFRPETDAGTIVLGK